MAGNKMKYKETYTEADMPGYSQLVGCILKWIPGGKSLSFPKRPKKKPQAVLCHNMITIRLPFEYGHHDYLR